MGECSFVKKWSSVKRTKAPNRCVHCTRCWKYFQTWKLCTDPQSWFWIYWRKDWKNSMNIHKLAIFSWRRYTHILLFVEWSPKTSKSFNSLNVSCQCERVNDQRWHFTFISFLFCVFFFFVWVMICWLLIFGLTF